MAKSPSLNAFLTFQRPQLSWSLTAPVEAAGVPGVTLLDHSLMPATTAASLPWSVMTKHSEVARLVKYASLKILT